MPDLIISDEDLVVLAQKSDKEAEEILINKYKRLVIIKSRAYFLMGADSEDLIQEGMIGLFKAIRDFDSSKKVLFCIFAEICILRQLLTAVKTATRKKHQPLNSYISISANENEKQSIFVKLELSKNPEEVVIDKENRMRLETNISEKLSELEKKILSYYMQGLSYKDTADEIGKNVKTVDNAIQRIRRKLQD